MRAVLAIVVLSVSSAFGFVMPLPKYSAPRTVVRMTGPKEGAGSGGQQNTDASEFIKSVEGPVPSPPVGPFAKSKPDWEANPKEDDGSKIFKGSTTQEEDHDQGFVEVLDKSGETNMFRAGPKAAGKVVDGLKELVTNPGEAINKAQAEAVDNPKTQWGEKPESPKRDFTGEKQDGVEPDGYGASGESEKS